MSGAVDARAFINASGRWMMRTLKTVALVIFVVAVVCAGALIAAWPLRATPSASAQDVGTGAGAPIAPPVESGDPGRRAAPGAPSDGGPEDSGPGAVAMPSGVVSGEPSPPDSRAGARTPQPHERVAAPAGPRTHDASRSPLEGAVTGARAAGITQSAIAIDRRSGRVTASADPDVPMAAMSLVKLMIAVDLLDRAGGIDHLDPGLQRALWQMITVSDDAVASKLWIAGGDGNIVTRISSRYHLIGVHPPANPGMWGDTTVTARAIAQFLRQALADPDAGGWLSKAMVSAADSGADGFDQHFGMNALPGAGSKQGWGCCLRGVRSLDSAGFTSGRIVVVLSAANPATGYGAMRSALTATAAAAVQG